MVCRWHSSSCAWQQPSTSWSCLATFTGSSSCTTSPPSGACLAATPPPSCWQVPASCLTYRSAHVKPTQQPRPASHPVSENLCTPLPEVPSEAVELIAVAKTAQAAASTLHLSLDLQQNHPQDLAVKVLSPGLAAEASAYGAQRSLIRPKCEAQPTASRLPVARLAPLA